MLRDSVWVFTTQGIRILAALALSAVLARNLSVKDFGLYQLVLSYIFLFNFVSLPGFSHVNIKSAAKGIDSVFYLSYRYSLLGSLFGFAGCLITGGILYFIFDSTTLGFLFMVGSVYFPLSTLNLFDSFLVGTRRFGLSRILMIINSLMGLIFIGAIAFFTKSLVAVFITAIMIKALYVFTGFLKTNKLIQRRELQESDSRYFIKFGLRMTFIGIFGTVSNQLEKVILGTLNPVYLSYYFIGSLIPRKIKDNSKAILSVPAIYWIKLSRSENIERVKQYWWIFAGAGFFCFCILYFGSPFFIPWIYGERYKEAVWVTQWLSFSIIFHFLNIIILNIVAYQGDEILLTRISVTGSILKIVLFLILIPLYQVQGIIASIVSTEVIMFIVVLVWFIKNIKMEDKITYAES